MRRKKVFKKSLFDYLPFRVGIGLMKVNLIAVMAPMASPVPVVATAPPAHQLTIHAPVAITVLSCRLRNMAAQRANIRV